MPIDRFDREINYLRISVIDRCNLRCTYCMPLEGLQFAPKPELLTPDEIGRLVQAAVAAGFKKFRLTGGEPTLRADLAEIVRRIRAVPGVDELAMTTNGILLPQMAFTLAEAGLTRVNIHIDTLNDLRARQIMRFTDLAKVWAGIEAAEAAGLTPLKLNTVVVKGVNDSEDVLALAARTLEHPWHVRFIELMPLGGGESARFAKENFVSNQIVMHRLERAFGALEPLPSQNPSDESRNYRIPGAPGVLGFISPVSEPFCGTCNRMRITATGKFHLCLLHDQEIDVREVLRSGGEEALRELLVFAVGQKPSGHDLAQGISTEIRSMYHLGG
ncbi:MAG: GTP 3',8-cyclase MoaA [Planctomycetota bacterium]